MPCVHLRIKGLGHVPAFKNSKMLSRGRTITDPKKQVWMERAIESIQSQLLSAIPIGEGETVTAQKVRSWIASAMPADDCSKFLIACSWQWLKVEKGEEGAWIRIEAHEKPS